MKTILHSLLGRCSVKACYIIVNSLIFVFSQCILMPLFLFVLHFPEDFMTPRVGLILYSVSSIFTTIILSFLLSFFISNSFRSLAEGFSSLSRGDFSVRLDLTGPKEFQRISAAFNCMADSLSGIEMMRRDFINDFSHEFKTPIVSIAGFAKLLKRKTLSRELQQSYLDIIIEEAEHISALSGNILMLSRIERQTSLTNASRFNLTEQLRRIIAVLLQKWESRDISFSFESEEFFLCANADLLYEVWMNLLDNAVKFSDDPCRIEISIRPNSETVVVRISDNGPGIGEADLLHIFDKFYQSDKSHVHSGNGLGLPIVKRIAELHGGSIRVADTSTAGSTFEVILPADYHT